MRTSRDAVERAWRWISDNFTRKRLIAGIITVIISGIPDWQGRIAWWHKAWPSLSAFMGAHGRLSLFGLGVLIIVVDHGLVVRKKREPLIVDESLRGRTIRFCDELRAFEKEMGPQPKVNWTPGNSARTFTEANQGLIQWEQRLHHRFHLRFYDRAVRLWHEHGAEVRESQPLADALQGRMATEEKLNDVIRMFLELAKDEN